MSRRHSAVKREVHPDPKFGNVVVTKFANSLMFEGRKSIAERLLYSALDQIDGKGGQSGLDIFLKAVDSVQPNVEIRSRRVGGATYPIPTEVRPERARALSIRWLITAARRRPEHTMVMRLAGELVDASNEKGEAVKKRETTHKMAEANRVFAHYKW